MKKRTYFILMLSVIAFVSRSQTVQKQSEEPIITPTMENPLQSQVYFIGGPEAYAKFLRTNIHYPSLAVKDKIEGRAIIKFVVEKDGSLSNFKLEKDPGGGLGEEAVRVLKLSPKWSPGKLKDKFVRVQTWVFVPFELPN